MSVLLLLPRGPALQLLCEAKLPVTLVPNTYSADQPPRFVPKGWEWKGRGWCTGGEHGTAGEGPSRVFP